MNRIIKVSLAAAAAVILAASCEKEPDYTLKTLSFEGSKWDALVDNPQYGGPLLYGKYDEANFTYLGTDYAWYDQGNTELASELCDSYGSKVFWNGGHAVSNYTGQPATTDYTLQLAIPLESGHDGSKNFCVHNGFKSEFSKNVGYFYFKDGTARTIESMYITNTSYYLGTVEALAKDTDWTKVTATGYNAEGTVTGTSEFYLTENGKSINEWTLWDLTSLGTPVKVEFDITSSIQNEYGMAAPGYFAYDDVTVRM